MCMIYEGTFMWQFLLPLTLVFFSYRWVDPQIIIRVRWCWYPNCTLHTKLVIITECIERMVFVVLRKNFHLFYGRGAHNKLYFCFFLLIVLKWKLYLGPIRLMLFPWYYKQYPQNISFYMNKLMEWQFLPLQIVMTKQVVFGLQCVALSRWLNFVYVFTLTNNVYFCTK